MLLKSTTVLKDALSEVLQATLSSVDLRLVPEATPVEDLVDQMYNSYWKLVTAETVEGHALIGCASLLCIQRKGAYNNDMPKLFKECIKVFDQPRSRSTARRGALRAIQTILESDVFRSPTGAFARRVETILQKLVLTTARGNETDYEATVQLVEAIATCADARTTSTSLSLLLKTGDTTLLGLSVCSNLFSSLSPEESTLEFTETVQDQARRRPWTKKMASRTVDALMELGDDLKLIIATEGSRVANSKLDATFTGYGTSQRTVLAIALECWEKALHFLHEDTLGVFKESILPTGQLVYLTSNSNNSVRNEARAVLEMQFVRFSKLRSVILLKVSSICREIPVDTASLLEETLQWLSKLLALWKASAEHLVRETELGPASFPDRSSVEANMIILLCHPVRSVRGLGLKVLEGIDNVVMLSKLPSAKEIPTPTFKKLAQLALSDTLDDLKIWRRVMAWEISSLSVKADGCFFLRTCLFSVWKEISAQLAAVRSKVEGIKRADLNKERSLRGSAEFWLSLWKSYMVVGAALLIVRNGNSDSLVHSASLSVEPKDARDFFRSIIAFWINSSDIDNLAPVSPSPDEQRDAVVEALVVTHPLAAEIMLLELQRSVEDTFADDDNQQVTKRSKRRRELLRTQVEDVYRHLIPKLRDTRFRGNLLSPKYSNCFSLIENHLRSTSMFLSRFNEDNSPFIQSLRGTFCMSVAELYEAVYEEVRTGTITTDNAWLLELFATCASWGSYGHRKGNLSRLTRETNSLGEEEWRSRGSSRDMSRNASPSTRAVASIVAVGPCDDNFLVEVNTWIYSVFYGDLEDDHATAQQGLSNFLRRSESARNVIIDLCYPREPGDIHRKVVRSFFLVLCRVISSDHKLVIGRSPEPRLLTLLLWMIGESVRYLDLDHFPVATEALKATITLFHASVSQSGEEREEIPLCLSGSVLLLAEEVQQSLSTMFADHFPELAVQMCYELIFRIENSILHNDDRRRALRRLLPWIEALGSDSRISLNKLARKLLNLTRKYGNEHQEVFFIVWKALAVHRLFSTIAVVIDDTLRTMQHMHDESWDSIDVFKQIVVFLSIANPGQTIGTLSEYIQRHSLGGGGGLDSVTEGIQESGKPGAPSNGDACLVLLAEVVYRFSEEMLPFLPIILHAGLLGLQNSSSIASESSKYLLANVIHSLVIARPGILSETHDHQLAKQLFSELVLDFSMNSLEIQESTPFLSQVVSKVVHLITLGIPDAGKDLAHYSLWFSMRSQHEKLCTNSLVIFSCSASELSVMDAKVILGALRSSVNSSPQSRSTQRGIELMKALLVVITRAPNRSLERHCLLFWGMANLLQCEIPVIQSYAAGILAHIVSRVLLRAPSASLTQTFSRAKPDEWTSFEGLRPLLIKSGAVFREQSAFASRLLLSMVSFSFDPEVEAQFFGVRDRGLIYTIVGLLPWLSLSIERGVHDDNHEVEGIGWDLLQSLWSWERDYFAPLDMDNEEDILHHLIQLLGFDEPHRMVARQIDVACQIAGHPHLGQVFAQYAEESIALSAEEFLFMLQKPLAQACVPGDAGIMVQSLIHCLTVCPHLYHESVLRIILSFLRRPRQYPDFVISSISKRDTLESILPLTHGKYYRLAVHVLDLFISQMSTECILFDDVKPYSSQDLVKKIFDRVLAQYVRDYSMETPPPVNRQFPVFQPSDFNLISADEDEEEEGGDLTVGQREMTNTVVFGGVERKPSRSPRSLPPAMVFPAKPPSRRHHSARNRAHYHSSSPPRPSSPGAIAAALAAEVAAFADRTDEGTHALIRQLRGRTRGATNTRKDRNAAASFDVLDLSGPRQTSSREFYERRRSIT
mmetsp:Transcript_16697/g.34325  ORF Transcript_16697/g.34325 Transcript_16697/m.34325 type:complete len:1829 (-) Transcript_16697:2986-8472(-)